MIKKKYVIIFMVIYTVITLSFFVHASLLAPVVSALAPAAATATTGGGLTLPAKIFASTSTGATVLKWVSLAVPGTAVAKIVGAGLLVAGALAADYLMVKGSAWLLANNYNIDPDDPTNITKTTTASLPPGKTPADYFTGTGEGFFASAAAASAACEADRATEAVSCQSKYPPCTVPGSCGMAAWPPPNYETLEYAYASTGNNGSGRHDYYFAKTPPPAGSHTETFENPSSNAQLEKTLADSLAAGNAAAKDMGKAGMEVAATAVANPGSPVAKNKEAMDKINAALIGSLTPTQKTNLEAAATPNVGDNVLPDDDAEKLERLTPAQIAAAVKEALKDQGLSAKDLAAAIAAAQQGATGGLTQAQLESTLQSQGLSASQIAAAITAAGGTVTKTDVKEAVKEAIDDETGVTPPVDPTITLPTKLSLTTILNDFWTSVQALPIFNVLNGITITTSGSSSLCIDLPAAYGGQRCYNAANVQDELNMIGSVILGLTTVVSFIGIFKG